jgi:hypothetical protein
MSTTFAPSGASFDAAETTASEASALLPSTPAEVPRIASHLVVAGIAAPALVFAGWQYPGSWKARAFLVATGLAIGATHYHYFATDGRRLYDAWRQRG